MKFYSSVRKFGNKLLIRGIEQGSEFKEEVKYEPTLFVRAQNNTETKYKDIYGNPCIPIKFSSMPDCAKWVKEQKTITNVEVLGMDNFMLAYISDNYSNMKYNFNQLRTYFLDIEVYKRGGFPYPIEAEGVIDAITIYDNIDDKYYVWGLKPWEKHLSELQGNTKVGTGKNKQTINLTEDILDKVVYKQFPSEEKLLINFVLHWQEKCPDIITGWNVEGFDIPYIVKRTERILGETASLKYSPWNKIQQKTKKDDYGKESLSVDILGCSVIDYQPAYKKFGFRPPRAFYSLDYISYIELGQKKLEYRGTHADQSDNDYQGYIDYNIKDVWLVVQLNKKLELLRLVAGLSYDAGINFPDTFSPVKMWDAIIFNHLRKEDIVIPERKQHTKVAFPGAYCKEVIPGLYKWIMTFDLTSLYPMLMAMYNISPETIVNKLPTPEMEHLVTKKHKIDTSTNYTHAANGMQYTKEFKGVIPIVSDKVFNSRIEHKELMKVAKEKAKTDAENKQYWLNEVTINNVKQMSEKIAINSLYGAQSSIWFRYYNLDNASAITVSGQHSIKWIERKLNEFFDKLTGVQKDRCIAIDTDSVMFCLDDFVEKFLPNKSTEEITEALDKFAEIKCQPFIDNSYQELCDYVGGKEQRMHMDREVIADTGFWTAKKRYALNVLDMEGYRYETPELKIMGLECKKSSTPTFVQDAMEECIRIILQEDNNSLINFLERFEKEFSETDYRDICAISGVNHLKKYSDSKGMPIKGAQMHVKAALAYNRLCEGTDIPKIIDGQKINILPLKEPNKLQSPAIAFPQTGIPEEFNKKYILENANFYNIYEKVMLAPMKLIANAIDWKLDDQVDMTSFFE